ncbi:MAG TPA: FAD/NAD(P)-binding protein [Acetobacteraceae bacterium]|nr:FAD/NAD(P)-binding protein [Acetobacteraceae bacterium]
MTAAEDPFIPLPYCVGRVRRETGDTASLELLPLAGPRPSFKAGQFNMLTAFGVGEVAISMSGDPAGTEGFVHTVRNVGAVSGALARLETGAALGLRGPFGTAWPTEEAIGADVLIVAGGLGLAPLRPAIYEVLARRERYGRVVLLYGTRSPRDILYRAEMGRWRRRLDVDIEITVDHADPAWHGNVGVVPRLIPRMSFDPQNTFAMVCGPEVMMRFTASALHEAGVSFERIWISMERNMKCAIGLCGHCQFGPDFICKDGPVMRYDRIASLLAVREI